MRCAAGAEIVLALAFAAAYPERCANGLVFNYQLNSCEPASDAAQIVVHENRVKRYNGIDSNSIRNLIAKIPINLNNIPRRKASTRHLKSLCRKKFSQHTKRDKALVVANKKGQVEMIICPKSIFDNDKHKEGKHKVQVEYIQPLPPIDMTWDSMVPPFPNPPASMFPADNLYPPDMQLFYREPPTSAPPGIPMPQYVPVSPPPAPPLPAIIPPKDTFFLLPEKDTPFYPLQPSPPPSLQQFPMPIKMPYLPIPMPYPLPLPPSTVTTIKTAATTTKTTTSTTTITTTSTTPVTTEATKIINTIFTTEEDSVQETTENPTDFINENTTPLKHEDNSVRRMWNELGLNKKLRNGLESIKSLEKMDDETSDVEQARGKYSPDNMNQRFGKTINKEYTQDDITEDKIVNVVHNLLKQYKYLEKSQETLENFAEIILSRIRGDNNREMLNKMGDEVINKENVNAKTPEQTVIVFAKTNHNEQLSNIKQDSTSPYYRIAPYANQVDLQVLKEITDYLTKLMEAEEKQSKDEMRKKQNIENEILEIISNLIKNSNNVEDGLSGTMRKSLDLENVKTPLQLLLYLEHEKYKRQNPIHEDRSIENGNDGTERRYTKMLFRNSNNDDNLSPRFVNIATIRRLQAQRLSNEASPRRFIFDMGDDNVQPQLLW